MHPRLTVEDAAKAHVTELVQAPAIGFDTFIMSAPTPFDGTRDQYAFKASELKIS